ARLALTGLLHRGLATAVCLKFAVTRSLIYMSNQHRRFLDGAAPGSAAVEPTHKKTPNGITVRGFHLGSDRCSGFSCAIPLTRGGSTDSNAAVLADPDALLARAEPLAF